MQEQANVIECYNKVADNYAEKFGDELSHKHLDRILLQSFANENNGKGQFIDLGCGPGQTTKYLSDCGVANIVGTDIAPAMVETAKRMHPAISFDLADMLHLPYADNSIAAAVAFYAIVHFNDEQLMAAFKEIARVLQSDGQFLFSFHVGDALVHHNDFLGHEVSIDFYFFNTEKVIELICHAGFDIVDCILAVKSNGRVLFTFDKKLKKQVKS